MRYLTYWFVSNSIASIKTVRHHHNTLLCRRTFYLISPVRVKQKIKLILLLHGCKHVSFLVNTQAVHYGRWRNMVQFCRVCLLKWPPCVPYALTCARMFVANRSVHKNGREPESPVSHLAWHVSWYDLHTFKLLEATCADTANLFWFWSKSCCLST